MQNVELAQDGLQFFQSIPRSSYDDDGWIRPAEESEVPAKNEMSYGDCQLANFGRQPSPPHVLAQVSDPRFGRSKLVHDGLQFFQCIHCSSYDDGGWIHPAEESEVSAKSEIDYSDFQLANTGQSSPHVLSQVADARCGTSKLMQDWVAIFPFHTMIFI